MFDGCEFQQRVDISVGMQLCYSSRQLNDVLVRGRLHIGYSQEKKNPARSFHFTFRHILCLPLTNSKFGDFC